MFIFFNYTATTDIYTYLHTLSLHDALPIYDAYAVVVLFFVVPGCLQRTSRDNCQKSGSQCTVPGTHFFCYHRSLYFTKCPVPGHCERDRICRSHHGTFSFRPEIGRASCRESVCQYV